MDVLAVLNACVDGKIDNLKLKWKKSFACNIIAASSGYPGEYEKGKVISGIEEAEKEKDIIIFYAGTSVRQGLTRDLVTNGGRVLGVSATGASLQEALDKAYKAIEKISFEGMQYRRDIGKQALSLSK